MKLVLLVIIVLMNLLPVAAQKTDSITSPVSIYLTFDDGPMHASNYLLEAIQRDSIPVTVFLVGRQVVKNSRNRSIFSWYKSNPFVEIANHSFSHANGKYNWYYDHPARVVDDIVSNETILGSNNKIVRLPGRNVWRIAQRQRNDLADASVAADSLAATGYDIYGWDLEWCYDTSGKSNYKAAYMIEQVNYFVKYGYGFARNHIVILCHDQMLLNEQTRIEFELFIRQLKNDGRFAFRFISEYPVTKSLASH